jgi:superfamily II DNA or RNA helicase
VVPQLIPAATKRRPSYEAFLISKHRTATHCGFKANNLNPHLKDFQAALVEWFCLVGRAGCFAATGLGKTLQELAWAEQVVRHTNKDVLIVCPLAVASQTKREAEKFHIGVDAHLVREPSDVKRGINLVNYERIHKIDASRFVGVSLDEASILKHSGAKMRSQLISAFRHTPYKLPATATPAPNDYMELGSQSEFCGWMNQSEMLSTFFTHDSGKTSSWRLRGHAREEFWKWMASWSAMIQKPSDLGFSDDGYILPPLNYFEHSVPSNPHPGFLFSTEAKTLADQRQSRRDSLEDRARAVADLVNADHTNNNPWIVWCGLNDESERAARLIPDAIEVTGSQSVDEKEEKLLAFINGQSRVLITKASIAGFGLNLQHCADKALLGIDNSYESYFQLIRRCWRFGQKRPVNVHIVISDSDSAVIANLKRKEMEHEQMAAGMVAAMQGEMRLNVKGGFGMNKMEYVPKEEMNLPEWV